MVLSSVACLVLRAGTRIGGERGGGARRGEGLTWPDGQPTAPPRTARPQIPSRRDAKGGGPLGAPRRPRSACPALLWSQAKGAAKHSLRSAQLSLLACLAPGGARPSSGGQGPARLVEVLLNGLHQRALGHRACEGRRAQGEAGLGGCRVG